MDWDRGSWRQERLGWSRARPIGAHWKDNHPSKAQRGLARTLTSSDCPMTLARRPEVRIRGRDRPVTQTGHQGSKSKKKRRSPVLSVLCSVFCLCPVLTASDNSDFHFAPSSSVPWFTAPGSTLIQTFTKQGYEADNANIKLLRLRSFTIGKPLADEDLTVDNITALIAIMEPMVSASISPPLD